MPHVVVKMYPGTSEEQKNELAKQITDAVMSITQKPEAAVSVAIKEVPESEWMNQVYETEIRPNLEKLYKKPGY
ncbi:4-oxalocrotonate tautomerase [Labilibaculum manganireducens]|uniref:4-oxalocrotonate tautomerase n=1 Tax=Labilibaculum manganireducens TaxID=1940525 RepID=A0A2N3I1H5_9BACT|nr:tautomerase family protein [Labilibaculum manganireducens]PKQ64151.1 4-oxalocrotonate tautomerase [Labilibaculum manganireducens]